MTLTEASERSDVRRLGELTRRYARFSLSAGGLGSVLGGALVLVTYFVGALVTDLGTTARIALALAPIVWIVVKEFIRTRYYQRHGRVEEARTDGDRRWHLGFTLFTAVVSVAIFVFVLLRNDAAAFASFETIGYLAYVAAMPLLVWWFMRTPLEFIVGVFLVAQAALMLGGGNYELGQQPQAPIVAVIMIILGVRQHREFIELSRQLASLRAATR